MAMSVRKAACARRFYPGEAAELRRQVSAFVDAVDEGPDLRPKALIAPHAGYPFSGPIAGHAFAAAADWSEEIERVVLLGPSHFVPVDGLCATSHDQFETPLGRVDIDRDTIDELAAADLLAIDDEPHRREHSLETHLPFLQALIGDFEIVPVVTGRDVDHRVADLLASVWGGSETLISISSDLSHFLDYETAKSVDDRTRAAIEDLDADRIDDRQACGNTSIRGLIHVARDLDLDVETLAMCNSGDTAGDKDEVVGYGAWSFCS